MDVTLHYPKELKRLLKNAAKADQVAITMTLTRIRSSGLDLVQTKAIKKRTGLREILIDAENRYRIMYTVAGGRTPRLELLQEDQPRRAGSSN